MSFWVLCSVTFSHVTFLKGPVHHYIKFILIKPICHACSNGIGTAVHNKVGEKKVAKGVEISRKKLQEVWNLTTEGWKTTKRGAEIQPKSAENLPQGVEVWPQWV